MSYSAVEEHFRPDGSESTEPPSKMRRTEGVFTALPRQTRPDKIVSLRLGLMFVDIAERILGNFTEIGLDLRPSSHTFPDELVSKTEGMKIECIPDPPPTPPKSLSPLDLRDPNLANEQPIRVRKQVKEAFKALAYNLSLDTTETSLVSGFIQPFISACILFWWDWLGLSLARSPPSFRELGLAKCGDQVAQDDGSSNNNDTKKKSKNICDVVVPFCRPTVIEEFLQTADFSTFVQKSDLMVVEGKRIGLRKVWTVTSGALEKDGVGGKIIAQMINYLRATKRRFGMLAAPPFFGRMLQLSEEGPDGTLAKLWIFPSLAICVKTPDAFMAPPTSNDKGNSTGDNKGNSTGDDKGNTTGDDKGNTTSNAKGKTLTAEDIKTARYWLGTMESYLLQVLYLLILYDATFEEKVRSREDGGDAFVDSVFNYFNRNKLFKSSKENQSGGLGTGRVAL